MSSITYSAPASNANRDFGAKITVFRKHGGPLTKRLSLNAAAALIADGSACVMSLGAARVADAPSAAALAEIIAGLESNEALGLGVLADGTEAEVVTKAVMNGHPGPGMIARTADSITFRPGAPAWCLLDFDAKGMPASVRQKIDDLGGFAAAIAAVLPEIAGMARVARASTSAGLARVDTGAPIAGSSGQHLYLLARDGADIPRFLKALHARAWLAGLGWLMAGAGGQALERSIVDRMVGEPERLAFEGAPVLVPPLVQDAAARRPIATEGAALDTLAAMPPLTIAETARLREMIDAERHRIAGDLAASRSRFIERHAAEIATRTGASLPAARRIAERHAEGILLPDVSLPFDDPALAGSTVAQVLADPQRFAGETLADPLEGVGYGRCCAKILLRSDGSPWINSFAHGRTIYELRHDAASVRRAIDHATAPDAIDVFVNYALAADLRADENEELIAAASRVSGIGTRAIGKRLADERAEHAARRIQAEASRRAAERDDPRPSLEAPLPDAEWLPVMAALNEVLGKSPAPEPPMRDADGCLVAITERSIASMHLLTSANVNGDAPAEELQAAPPMPLITRLDDPQAAELIEQHIEYIIETKSDGKRPVHLGAQFVKHFVRRHDDALPRVSAVLTLPVVSGRGELLSGRGLDRKLGVVFRIPEALMANLPDPRAIGPTQIARAMQFLADEWLADVATTYEGKCVLIAMAISIVERSLLPERPGFFISAGKRGTGKTTVASMISSAVLGMRAAAAAWSPDPEERRKTLFAALAEGAPLIVWDNIPLAAALQCPSIEKALTSETYSDRVLGVSERRTVPSATIQVFTGNNVTAAGDLASRCLTARLTADRPDPENRPFRHPDPIGWTLANRPKILRAMYVILLGNRRFRETSPMPAATRFKAWWHLVGAPIEQAAAEHAEHIAALAMDPLPGCAPTRVSFRDIFAAAERDDDQAAGLATVLDMCRRNWPTGFSAADVADVCGRADPEGEALRASLEAAAGKAVKIISPTVIAWRLKAVVDAPVPVGADVLALRYMAGHEGGVFSVRRCA